MIKEGFDNLTLNSQLIVDLYGKTPILLNKKPQIVKQNNNIIINNTLSTTITKDIITKTNEEITADNSPTINFDAYQIHLIICKQAEPESDLLQQILKKMLLALNKNENIALTTIWQGNLKTLVNTISKINVKKLIWVAGVQRYDIENNQLNINLYTPISNQKLQCIYTDNYTNLNLKENKIALWNMFKIF